MLAKTVKHISTSGINEPPSFSRWVLGIREN